MFLHVLEQLRVISPEWTFCDEHTDCGCWEAISWCHHSNNRQYWLLHDFFVVKRRSWMPWMPWMFGKEHLIETTEEISWICGIWLTYTWIFSRWTKWTGLSIPGSAGNVVSFFFFRQNMESMGNKRKPTHLGDFMQRDPVSRGHCINHWKHNHDSQVVNSSG